MSLPSVALFYNKKRGVGKSFVNCGWFWNPDDISMVKRVLMDIDYPDKKWDRMVMYGEEYSYQQVIDMVVNEV